MAEIIRMPEVLAGATEAAIQTWLVDVGTAVAVGAPYAEIETDKAIVELNAESAGTIGRLLAAEGDSVKVGEPILVLLGDGENDDAITPALAAAGTSDAGAEPSDADAGFLPAATVEPRVTVASTTSAAAEAPAALNPSHRLFISPLVRRLAADAGVALADLHGTGPQGRVVRRDLERHLVERSAPPRRAQVTENTVPAAAAPSATPASSPTVGFEDVPLDRMRRAIARRLTESKSTVPHFYLTADCRVDRLLELRQTVNDSTPRKNSVNDFVLKAVAGALVDVPEANAIWNGDSIRRFAGVDISVAVATDGGLTTPVVRDAHRLSLGELSATVADLAARAREGRLKQHELEGGSFSVSNLGMYGTTEFSAILNPPQSGILAVGAARAVPVVTDNGTIAAGHVMTVTLSADHRVLDGAVAAQWLSAFQRRIENPLTILI